MRKVIAIVLLAGSALLLTSSTAQASTPSHSWWPVQCWVVEREAVSPQIDLLHRRCFFRHHPFRTFNNLIAVKTGEY